MSSFPGSEKESERVRLGDNPRPWESSEEDDVDGRWALLVSGSRLEAMPLSKSIEEEFLYIYHREGFSISTKFININKMSLSQSLKSQDPSL